ncbi:nucleoside diphosphate kinase 6-like isoform X1 [Neodiprion virginianus]|uniref:Nucleoside diphosphate kinase n=1 Tax=Neodiprion lecontei TaxID=441921 RepID=A0A6J0BL00_NEOLC|nr:nucleoside diphosphate kinase 6 isoform X1 [Neodiprion lecontei]XP_046616259.1 nucleoside diphosphate kinase 6-like isoform X1 [Neodiprion virginianus]
MKSKQPLQLTLAILKPHVVKSPFVLQKIRDLIIDEGFKVVRSRRTIITPMEAESFYADHKEKFFYNRLMTFMCSGPSDIHILTAHDAIAKWRTLMGPTKVYQAQFHAPHTIRGMYGLSDTRNATHGSDSPESSKREIAIFFKEFNIEHWFKNEEIFYNSGNLKFDPSLFIHTIDRTRKINESDQDTTMI